MPQGQELATKADSLVLVGPVLKNPPRLPAALRDAPCVAVDGGIHFAPEAILWAGDGDSGFTPVSIPALLKQDQNLTDFRFCLDAIRSWRWTELHLFGFLGGRKDHELANFGEIHAEMKARPGFLKAAFYDEDSLAHLNFLQAGRHTVTIEGAFSVMTLEPAEISIAGQCRYAAEKITLSPLSGRGVSNEGTGAVQFTSSMPFLLILGL